MFKLFQGPLFEAVGTPVTAPAPAPVAAPAVAPAAPAPVSPTVIATPAEATTQGDQNAWAQIAKEAASMSATPAASATETAAPAAALALPGQVEATEAKPVEATTTPEPEQPAKKKLPEIADWKPATAQERYLQSQALREQQRQEQTLKAQYETQLQTLQRERDDAAAAINRFRTLRGEGKIDDALKALGEDGMEALTKAHLQAKGALPKEDPRVTALQRELEQLKTAEQKRQEALQQQQAELQARQYHAQMVATVREEMIASGYERIPQLANVVGFPEYIWNSVQADPNAPPEHHYALAEKRFRGIYDALAPVYGGQQPPAQAVSSDPTPVTSVGTPAQPGAAVVRPGGVSPPAVLPQSAAADARGSTTFTGNDDADWNSLMTVFRQQPTG